MDGWMGYLSRRSVLLKDSAITFPPCVQRQHNPGGIVTGLPSLLPPLAAAKQAEDYKILS